MDTKVVVEEEKVRAVLDTVGDLLLLGDSRSRAEAKKLLSAHFPYLTNGRVLGRADEKGDKTYTIDLTELSNMEVCWLRGALIALIIHRDGWRGAMAILRDVGEVLAAEGLLPGDAPQ